MIGGEGEAGVFGDLKDGLDEALAEGGFADDESAVVILQGAGDDLSRGCRVAIDQDDDGELWSLLAASGAIDLIGEGATALGDDDLAFLKELVGHIDCFVQETAGVAAEVEDEAVDVAELVERVADFVAGGFDEAGDVDVADAGAKQEGEVDRGTGNLVADEIEDQWAGGAFAHHRDGDVGAACAFEHGGYAGGVHAFGGFAVDGENLVAWADAGFIGGGAFEGVEDYYFGFAAGGGLWLDGHANAVVLAVLVLAHLGEGFGVVEVGVWIKDVEHAGDGTVVDGFVGLVGVEGLGVVLLDEGVDIGEGVERVAEGGLIAGRLGGDFLVDK